MYTCAGANSVPVCVSPQDREASKSNAVCWPFIAPCCGFIPSDAPSPLRTPEDSQTYEHISRSILPVSARPVSVCQLPTFSDVTPVQARKRAGRGKNPFLFAMLFEKNIEIFSDPNPSVLCVFSICLPPFRAWVQGGSVQAGAWQEDTVREVYGSMSGRNSWIYVEGKGALATTGATDYFLAQISPGGDGVFSGFDFRLSRSIPTGPITAPPHVWQPVILYLGEKA